MTLLLIYILLFTVAFLAYRRFAPALERRSGIDRQKTIRFGDAAAIRSSRIASVLSIVTLFFLWGLFTGSQLLPFHLPAPFEGKTSFSFTYINPEGVSNHAEVKVLVGKNPASGSRKESGFISIPSGRTAILPLKKILPEQESDPCNGCRITKIEGTVFQAKGSVKVANGTVGRTDRGSLTYTPDPGMQMNPIWLPPPEDVFFRFMEVASDGYQNVTLFENLGWSLFRVLAGFFLGSLVGVPLGYAMGLSDWFRGWFDPIVEFMRPVPPLALIPLVIIWFGIWETGKISLLFLASLWIMTISGRAGVSGVNLSRVHAAYSLGASRLQVLLYVIIPNSLAEVFTGARVAMGVCWGTVVAAELVAAEKGAGKMIIAASKFQQTDVVIVGIILIGIIGYGMDLLMRKAEARLIPWKGKV